MRRPGQPYAPLAVDEAAARAAAQAVEEVLRPPPGVVQDYYLNARHFERLP